MCEAVRLFIEKNNQVISCRSTKCSSLQWSCQWLSCIHPGLSFKSVSRDEPQRPSACPRIHRCAVPSLKALSHCWSLISFSIHGNKSWIRASMLANQALYLCGTRDGLLAAGLQYVTLTLNVSSFQVTTAAFFCMHFIYGATDFSAVSVLQWISVTQCFCWQQRRRVWWNKHHEDK